MPSASCSPPFVRPLRQDEVSIELNSESAAGVEDRARTRLQDTFETWRSVMMEKDALWLVYRLKGASSTIRGLVFAYLTGT